MGYPAVVGGLHPHPPASWRGCRGKALDPKGKEFPPKGFTAGGGLHRLDRCANYLVSCWTSPPVHVPHQRDEGTLAHVISYLDKYPLASPCVRHGTSLFGLRPLCLLHLHRMNCLASYRGTLWSWDQQCCLCSSTLAA